MVTSAIHKNSIAIHLKISFHKHLLSTTETKDHSPQLQGHSIRGNQGWEEDHVLYIILLEIIDFPIQSTLSQYHKSRKNNK